MLITSHNKKKSSKKKYLIQLKLPNKLIKEINSLSLNIIYPMDNRYGMFDKYYQSIKDSLRQISQISFNAIFSLENNKNVNYLVYEPTYNENGFKKKLLLLDLDETLIHSEIRNKNNFHILNKLKDKANCYHKVFSYIDNNYLYYFDIFFRPHLFDFLHEIQNYFDIGIFTASSKGYADTIIDYIDPSHTIFNFRLYRDACIPIQNSIYIKDLRIIGNYEENNVILLDNSLYSFINQPKNGMLVYSFYWDDKDDQLIKAKNFLIKYLYKAKDVREELDKWYYYNEFKRKSILK
jgi:Dullard-like phosphatase family protein